MASELKVIIKDGKAHVTADGTPVSCQAADAVEAALGTTTKKVMTGTKPITTKVTSK